MIEHMVSTEELRELDELYEARSPSGRSTCWYTLVEELRKIRRKIEAGDVVQIEGVATLRTWTEFYNWAHGRYHMLEDGCDAWIGDDNS